jgi:3-hydroxyacyl-[acyl-carrier-protein] dehydratase
MSDERLLDLLRHRFPFLLIDRVLEREEGVFCRALKNLTINEPYFVGHFPGHPILPGVLMIEMMAQCAALIGLPGGKMAGLGYLAQVRDLSFLRPCFPGDQLVIEARLERRLGRLSRFQTSLSCQEQPVARGILSTATLAPQSKEGNVT